MSDDCGYGIGVVSELLNRFGLSHRWCYVDAAGRYHGLSRTSIEDLFAHGDLYLDIGSHGAWLEESDRACLRVLVDGEPGGTQIKMERLMAEGNRLPAYDRYYTNGASVGTGASTAPTAGKKWFPLYSPVVADLFTVRPLLPNAPFTTVMNWQAHEAIQFQGVTYGQKDVEFRKFINLPRLCETPLEVAVSGAAPLNTLKEAGWRVRAGKDATSSYDTFACYIAASAGEFSVCKNIYVAFRTGWFSDRSAAYLASGRPVVLQDTGFSQHLPCGEGLFAIDTPEDAAAAIEAIRAEPARHSKAARRIAAEYLDASVSLKRLMQDLNLQEPARLPRRRAGF
jgi:hypothetical protein